MSGLTGTDQYCPKSKTGRNHRVMLPFLCKSGTYWLILASTVRDRQPCAGQTSRGRETGHGTWRSRESDHGADTSSERGASRRATPSSRAIEVHLLGVLGVQHLELLQQFQCQAKSCIPQRLKRGRIEYTGRGVRRERWC